MKCQQYKECLNYFSIVPVLYGLIAVVANPLDEFPTKSPKLLSVYVSIL